MKLKKLFVYLSIIVVIVAAVDLLLGISMHKYVKSHEMPGDYRSLDYLLKDFDNDMLIMGSSVALNSLDPGVIGDSLAIDVYNGASNGQTFTYQLILLKSIIDRHTPEAVILGIKPEDLASEGDGNRINLLSPYYGMGYQAVDSVLDNQTYFSKAFNHSSLYRYNTIWFRILLYQFIEPGIKGHKGFIAKDIPTVFPNKDVREMDYTTMSDQRRQQLSEFVSLCKDNDIKLIMFFPPQYIDVDGDFYSTQLYKETKQMLEDSGMTLYDDTQNPVFVTDSTLFYDNSHLNVNGAEKYTNYFINRLRNDSIY